MKIVLDDKARIFLKKEIALHERERGALFITCEERRNWCVGFGEWISITLREIKEQFSDYKLLGEIKEFNIPVFLEEENCLMYQFQEELKISTEKGTTNEVLILEWV